MSDEKTRPEVPEAPETMSAAVDRVTARREQFEAEQKAREVAFERDQKAFEARQARDEADAKATAEEQERVTALIAENDEAALNDGFITHDDLLQRQNVLSQYHGALMPWEAVGPDEATVKMAFPRTVILTHSAGDVRRLAGDKGIGVREEGVREDATGSNRDLSVRGAIVPGSRVLFWKGYHDVPESLADHNWLIDNGARSVGKEAMDVGDRGGLERDEPRSDA